MVDMLMTQSLAALRSAPPTGLGRLTCEKIGSEMSLIWRRIAGVITAMMLLTGGAVATAAAASAASPLCNGTASTGESWTYNVFTVPVYSSSGYTESCYLNQIDTRNYNSGTVPLQDTLKRCYGQNITVDGKFGPATEAALKVAQGREGATADGRYGPQSRQLLKWPERSGASGSYIGTCRRVAL